MDPAAHRWFVVQTKCRREQLAARSICRNGLSVHLPRAKNYLKRRGSERALPLFPGYLFAQFCPLRDLDQVRYAQGVIRVLCDGSSPLPVADGVVEAIQASAAHDGFIHLRTPEAGPGDRVTISDGPLSGLIGRIARELDGGRRVALLLEEVWQAQLVIEKQFILPLA